MCRLYGFRGNEPTKVECALVHAQNALLAQSRRDRTKGETHPDGWGIGVYEGGVPEIERRATAAYEDLHFSVTAERVFARTVVAHVRQATVGGAALENTHPFVHGPWTWAHNGTLYGFEALRGELEAEIEPRFRGLWRGTTDSEFLFYWLLSKMARTGIDVDHRGTDARRLADVLAAAVPRLARLSARAVGREAKLNLLLTDGETLAVSRFQRGLCFVERDGVRDCEICGIPHVVHESSVGYRAVVVASEPLSHESWHEVPEASVVWVDRALRVEVQGF